MQIRVTLFRITHSRTMNGKEMRFALHENGTLMVSGKGADNVVRPQALLTTELLLFMILRA